MAKKHQGLGFSTLLIHNPLMHLVGLVDHTKMPRLVRNPLMHLIVPVDYTKMPCLKRQLVCHKEKKKIKKEAAIRKCM